VSSIVFFLTFNFLNAIEQPDSAANQLFVLDKISFQGQQTKPNKIRINDKLDKIYSYRGVNSTACWILEANNQS
jgi:hypothetical protein